MREKPQISFCFLVSGAHARLLTAFYRSVQYVAGCGWFPGRSRPTWPKNGIILREGSECLHWQKNNEKTTLWRWVFQFCFFAVFRGSCLATSNENWNVGKTQVFLCQCKRLYRWRAIWFKEMSGTMWCPILFPYAVIDVHVDRAGSTGKRTIWNLELSPQSWPEPCVLACPALFAFGETVYGNDIGGSAYWLASLSACTADLLAMNVSPSDIIKTWSINQTFWHPKFYTCTCVLVHCSCIQLCIH